MQFSTFAANINTARAPRRVFFSPPFNPDRFVYNIKLDPSEQAIFVSPSVLCERSQTIEINGQPTDTLLRPFGDYYYEVPGDSLVFEIKVMQRTDSSIFQIYRITIDKTEDSTPFIQSSEGLILILVCVVVVFGAAGSVYYVNKRANKKLKLIEEQDFDNFESFDSNGDASSPTGDNQFNKWLGQAAPNPPCVHCGKLLASPNDNFCRHCATEQPASSPINSPTPARAVNTANKFCRNCGKPAKNSADKFCWNCGTGVRTHNSKEI